MNIAAIDSGEKGAIAILSTRGELIDIMDMPFVKTTLSFVDSNEIHQFLLKHSVTEIAIEEVRGIRGKSTMQTVFRQGGSYFPLGHACWMLDIKPKLIDPKRWKRLLKVDGLKENSKKKKMFELACQAYPNQVYLFTGSRGGMLDGRTDAIGIGLAYLKERSK